MKNPQTMTLSAIEGTPRAAGIAFGDARPKHT